MTGRESNRDVWQFVDELGRAHHFIVWMIILEAERDGVYPINSSTVIQQMHQWTGEIPASSRVHRSMKRLQEEFGIVEKEPVDGHPTAGHWTTTEKGHECARVITEKWAYVLGAADREGLDR